MSEINGSGVKNSGISEIARNFNKLSMGDVVHGIKTAKVLNDQITEAQIEQEKNKANPVEKKEVVPTGAEIARAFQDGEYREIMEQPER